MKFHGFCMLKIRTGDTVVFFTLFLDVFIHLYAEHSSIVMYYVIGHFWGFYRSCICAFFGYMYLCACLLTYIDCTYEARSALCESMHKYVF